MSRTHLAFLAIGIVAGCAQGSNQAGGGSGFGSGSSSAGASSQGFGSIAGDGDASLSTGPSSTSAIPADAGYTLGDNGSGLCVSGRTCDPTCDELIENGAHEYIEQAPDDGSALPPSNVATLFKGTPSTSGGPCIVEPPSGAVFPNNWVRARFRFTPADTSQTIFQIRLHAARQANDLVVYTESKTWKIPKDVWTALAASTWGEDITATISAVAPGGGTPSSSSVTFQIAPAYADGSMVYWAAVGKSPGESWLESFGVGDENVAQALTVPQVQWTAARSEQGNPTSVTCIGCHVAVPDRQTVVFNDNWPWDGVSSMVDPNDTGMVPSWMTPGGAQALSMPWLGMMTFSNHVWNDLKQHIVVAAFQGESMFPNPWPTYLYPDGGGPVGNAVWGFQGSNEWDVSPKSQLAWIDLSTSAPVVTAGDGGGAVGDQLSLGMAANYGTSWGLIARDGDSSGVAAPTWSTAGDRIVYTSTNAAQSGRLATGTADLYSVPYNGGQGGAATPIMGASDPSYNEYFPSFSRDDKYVAFNRTPVADNMYYDPNSEVYVVPSTGGTATRLAANDPPACMGKKSPGLNNSWVKWSPEFPECGGKTYYWLVFSSSREGIMFGSQSEPTSQLYLTGMTDDGTGALTTDPAIFVWNQHLQASVTAYAGQQQSNHTPQWEPIDLPTPPPPPPPPPPPR